MKRGLWLWLLGLGVLLLALGTAWSLLYQVAYILLAVPFLALGWAWYNVHLLEVTRSVPVRRGQVGEVLEDRLAVRNRGPLAKLWVEVHDESTLPGHKASEVIYVGARKIRRWLVKTVAEQRGVYQLGPLTLVSGDPLGLFEFRRHWGEPVLVVVYPRTVEVTAFEVPAADRPGDARQRQRAAQATSRIASVRPYVPGDSLNRIHWRMTAHAGELMVKEFELDPVSDVWIVLDLQGRAQAGYGRESTEEYAVTAAASLARYFLQQNRAVGLSTTERERRWLAPDRTERQLLHVLELLALVRANGTLPLAASLGDEVLRLTRGTTAVVITPTVDVRWVPVLQPLRQRGVGTAAVLVDGASFGGPPGLADVSAALAAAQVHYAVIRKGDDLAQALRL